MAIHLPLRSISLPCRLHPTSLKIEQDLKSFKSLSFSYNSSSSTAESIQTGLTRLAELFISIQQLNPSFQTEHNQNRVEQLLDQSVCLIDICGIIRDMFLTMQEHVQGLQSALRRRGKDLSLSNNIQAYTKFRKNAKKTIAKSLRTLKKFEGSMIEDHGFSSCLIDGTREAHGVAANIFRSLLVVMNNNNNGRWSSISRLMLRSGSVDKDDDHKIVNEVESVDVALGSISKFEVKEVQGRLMALCDSIKQIEGNVDILFRCLIQNRVSLLNLITLC